MTTSMMIITLLPYFFSGFVVGFIFSLVLGYFLQKKQSKIREQKIKEITVILEGTLKRFSKNKVALEEVGGDIRPGGISPIQPKKDE